MLAALAALLNQGSAYLLAGVVGGRLGNRHPSVAPYATYTAADGQFAAGAGNDALLARLCATIGRPELAADPRFATNGDRRAHVDVLDAELDAVFATRPAADWVQALTAAGVPAGPINDVAAAYAMAEELGLGPVAEIDGLRLPAIPLGLSRTPPTVRRPPPGLGEHDAELRAWLQAL